MNSKKPSTKSNQNGNVSAINGAIAGVGYAAPTSSSSSSISNRSKSAPRVSPRSLDTNQQINNATTSSSARNTSKTSTSTATKAATATAAAAAAAQGNTNHSNTRKSNISASSLPSLQSSATLTDLTEAEKLKINRLVDKLFEISGKYEEIQQLLQSERQHHNHEINTIYEKINGQILIIEDQLKLKDHQLQSLTAKEHVLLALIVLYQKKLTSIVENDIPEYQQQIQSTKQMIQTLQSEQTSLQLIIKNDKQMIQLLEKDITEKNQLIHELDHMKIPRLEDLLQKEIHKTQKQEIIIQELQMKNRYYHNEIQQLQKKVQQLNDLVIQKQRNPSPEPPTVPANRSRSSRGKVRSDDSESPVEDRRSAEHRNHNSSQKKVPYHHSRSSTNRNHTQVSTSSRSRSPSPGVSSLSRYVAPANTTAKKENGTSKSTEDYSIMFQSTTSDDLRRYVNKKHIKDQEQEEVNYDLMFDTSNSSIRYDDRTNSKDKDDNQAETRHLQKTTSTKTTKSLDSADWMKVLKKDGDKRSKSRSADSSPEGRRETKENKAVNGERKRRTSDIFFEHDGEDSLTFTANKRPHTSNGATGTADHHQKESPNDTSLFYDQSLNLSTSNLSSLHISDEQPVTTPVNSTNKPEKPSEEDEIADLYYTVTRSAEKKKKKTKAKEEKEDPYIREIREEELLNIYDEKKEKLAKKKAKDMRREYLDEDNIAHADYDHEDNDSIKRGIAMLSPIENFTKVASDAAVMRGSNQNLKEFLGDKPISNSSTRETTSKKYALLSSLKPKEQSFDPQSFRASRDGEDQTKDMRRVTIDKEAPSIEKQQHYKSHDDHDEEQQFSSEKKKKSTKAVANDQPLAMRKVKKSDSLEDARFPQTITSIRNVVESQSNSSQLKKKSSSHSLTKTTSLEDPQSIIPELNEKDRKKSIKSLKSSDTNDSDLKNSSFIKSSSAATPKSGKKATRIKSRSDDFDEFPPSKTAGNNTQRSNSTAKRKHTPPPSNNKAITKSPGDSIYNASLFDLLDI